MKIFYTFFSIAVSLCIAGCSPMDDTYKNFIKDGPILYLSKIQSDSVVVQSGWYRAKITLPKINDNRSKRVLVTWNNRKDSVISELSTTGKTEISLDKLREGSIIFTSRLEDNDGNTSLNTDLSASIYGEIYQSYLTNRIISKQVHDGKDLYIDFFKLSDSTAISTSITWLTKSNNEISRIFTYDSSNKIKLEDFAGNSFKMKTLYRPDSLALDNVWSLEKEYFVEYFLNRTGWTVTPSHAWSKDGTINGSPESLIDGNNKTGLNLSKPGKGTTPSNATLFFVIDMQKENTFNCFSLTHRTDMTSEGLRIWKLSLYGSNDGISYQEIQKNIDIPHKATVKDVTIKLDKFYTYRYVKAVYEEFSTTQNLAIQIMEFSLGMKNE